jgi:hypothetical protein
MARMIPGTPPSPDAPGGRAEYTLYEAFRLGLDPSFTVYHGKLFVNPTRAGEGEMDFLVCHRELGLLAVECKGRSVRRDAAGQWVRGGRYGPAKKLRESPYEQVQRHIRDLTAALRPRMQQAGYVVRRNGPFPFLFGHAVAFPLTLIDDEPLPLEGSREITLCARDLRQTEQWVRGAYAYWARGKSTRSPPSPKKWKHFLEHLLHPEIRMVHTLGADLELETQRFHQLTEEQSRAIRGLTSNRRLRITGGAGTGKTVVAMELARSLALQGQRVLLLCYNRYLARHLWQTIQEWEFSTGTMEARHFHSLCLKAAERLKKEFSFPEKGDHDAQRSFWNEQMPLWLLEAQVEGEMPQYDAIIVDEGQDFDSDWWPLVEDLLETPDEGTLIVLHDDAQDIFGRGAQVPALGLVYNLSYNLRNTRCIAEVVQELGSVRTVPHPNVPEGLPPKVRPQAKGGKAISELEQLLHALMDNEQIKPDQIAILTPHSRSNSLLSGVSELAGQPLTGSPFEPGIFHGTISSYKGLESDVLVLADIDPNDPLCNRKARYVAASRAKLRLFVFARGDWMQPHTGVLT